MHRLRFPGHPAKLMSPFPPPECLPCPFTSLSQSFRGPIFLSSLHLPGPSGSNPSLHMLFPDIIHLSYIRLIASFLRTDYKLFSIFSPAIVPTFCYYPHPVFSTFNMCFWNWGSDQPSKSSWGLLTNGETGVRLCLTSPSPQSLTGAERSPGGFSAHEGSEGEGCGSFSQDRAAPQSILGFLPRPHLSGTAPQVEN